MGIIKVIFCIFYFVLCVVFYLLILFADWVIDVYKMSSRCVSKLCRRFYWAFMHASRHFDKFGR